MSTRSRRARGRPPKTPLSTNRTNFLRKPKAYQNQESLNNSGGGLSSVAVTHLRHGRSERFRGRAAAHKGRNFVSQLLAEDDEISSLPEFEDRSSDITDLDNTDAYGSDASYSAGSPSESSDDESLSTISSSVSRRRLLLKRPKTPDIQDDKELPQLNLPASATDLLLPTEHVLQAVGVYEILRHFRTILRLSPFTFEDFCACLLSEEQSNLLAEIHMTLLKALLREEENSGTTFGSQDLKDSINVSLYFLDPMTWPEILRSYLDSEKHPEYRTPLPTLESPDYPFVAYTEKLKVLQTLTDLFLATAKVREEIINEGNIHYDDHCRACHKLGDLLCCETCSAVYHLGCVEPPMQEVPEDDWLCSVCRAHQVKGVTDCVSEAERSGLMCRQEAIGYDRHARKYWFICRRIIVEGEKEVRYYSTKCQLEELLESLDPDWEPDLISFINEMKEDIIKQMSITEELTAASKGSRKSVLEVENAQLVKLQAERALQRKEEEKKKAKEEEERKKKQEEEEEKINKEDGLTDTGCSSKDEKSSETVEAEALVSTHTKQVTNSILKSSKGGVTTTEVVETTTTISTVTSVKSITTTTVTSSEGSIEDPDSEEPLSKKSKLDSTLSQQVAGKNSGIILDSNDASKADNKLLLSSSSALAEAIKSTADGKPKVISLHSLLPSPRQSILDRNGEDTKSEAPSKTVLLVNRGGGKVTLQVSRQPIGKDDQNGSSVTQSCTSSSVTASAVESRKMLTRSRTGSLTPKLFTDSITMTTTSVKASGKSSEEVLVLNKDGEITRVNRGAISVASSLVQQSIYFKLGSEGSYKQYQNQYTTNTLALNKHQHNEERDKKRHLSHKFSLTQFSEFKWNGNVMGNRMSVLATLRLTITQLEGNIQAPFLHPNWPNHRQNWQKAVQMCQSPRDFALALTILEACIKPCVMNPVWHESLGHLRLNRITSADREEFKKKEKEQKRRKEDEEEVRAIVWIKYTMGLKHQVWKQKGEEYRITGGNGWQWISSTRNVNTVPQNSVGLRLVAHKLINRRVRAAKSCSKNQKTEEGAEDVYMDTDSEPHDSSTGTEDLLSPSEYKPSFIKEEIVETKEKATAEMSNVNKEAKSEDFNEGLEMKSGGDTADNTSDSALTADVKIKGEQSEPSFAESSTKTNSKGRVTKIQKGQSTYESYLTFVKKKYIEDKETAFALEVLKKPPGKVDVELINVEEAMQKRTYYAKVTKPYSKLDNLLERRLKQDEFERKQRLTIETQIALKLKLQQASETAQKQLTDKDELAEKDIKLTNGDISDDSSLIASNLYSCYSLLCRSGGNDKVGQCYSPLCRLRQRLDGRQQKDQASSVSTAGSESQCTSSRTSKEGSPDNLINEDSMDSHISKGSPLSQEDDDANDIDVAGSKDDVEDVGLNKENEEEQANNSHAASSMLADKSMEDEEVDIEGDISRETVAVGTDDQKCAEENSSVEKRPAAGSSTEHLVKSDTPKASSVSEIVKNLVMKTISEKKVMPSVGTESLLNNQTLSASVANMSIADLRARLPPKHPTTDKFKLARFTRIGVKKKISKHGRLPMCHKFETKSKKKSVLILDRNELKKLARQGAKRESASFNYNCKMSSVCWPYPCPRPLFKTSWRYRTMTLQSLSAAALQLRILWASIRWDDMAAKPPAGGTNTVSTETEITTTELLKRREAGMDGLRSEFLVRKIVVPLGVPDKPKEKYTPQRSGLRERKKIESVRQTEPSVTEVWVPEEVLELWEIKQFGEKLEKQRQALQEKAEKAAANQQTIVTSQQSSAQIKAQMEQQLKQQRLALAQKRIQENQGVKITTGNNLSAISTLASASTTTIIINNSSQFGKAGATFKTLTVSSPSSLLSSGVIKTMQPKPVSANTGSLLGSQLRPGIRLQIPGSTIQIRPQTVLAPKPGTTITTTTGVSTFTRLISPATTTVARVLTPATTPATKTQTVQLRSQTPGAPVQNLHFTQTPGGQLQVRGLLPGQIIQRMPDGKLQIITLSTSTAAPATQALVTTSAPQQQPPRAATVSIRPQAIMVSPPAGSATTVTPTITQNRLVIPAQLASSLSVVQTTTSSPLSVPAIRQVLASSVAGTPTKPIIVTRPGGPHIISAQNIASVLNHGGQSLGTSSASTLVAASPVASSLNSAVVISSPAVINTATPAIISTSLAGVTTVLVNSSQPQLSNVASPPGQQTIISTLKPTVLSPAVTLAVTTTTTTIAGQSLLGGQIISGSSLIQRSTGGTSLINLNSTSGLTSTVSVSPVSSQIPKLLASSTAAAQIITRPLSGSQPQLMLRPGTSMLAGAGQAKIITTQQLRGLTASPIQLKPATVSLSPVKTVLSPPSSSMVVPAGSTPTLTAVRSLTPHLTIQTSTGQQQIIATGAATSLLPQGLTLTSSPEAGSASLSVASSSPGTSPSSKASTPKYAITPQVVEQVVRQALLQNQTPEIQQKLLAMQKQIQQQQQSQPAASMAVLAANSSNNNSVAAARRGFPSSIATVGKPASVATADLSRVKAKGLTQEQKEEQSRNSICGQVMKTILDRIEREEKQEQRNKKKQESAEEKHKRITAANQQKALFKHKEALKKEILRKRSLMEKNLQQEIYNEMADKVKKTKSSVAKSPQAGSIAVTSAASATVTAAATAAPLNATPVTPTAHARPKKVVTEMPKTNLSHLDNKSLVRKRKQKIISTGVKGLNPREKLYCVCKTPYDDSKFYIGCDLCSNWFHGACVNISEDRARFIDSYVCEDCRRQRENTSEELYCLCRTPYDENHGDKDIPAVGVWESCRTGASPPIDKGWRCNTFTRDVTVVRFYIGCDRCQDWFHGHCVGISKQEADSIEVYVCPNCQKEEVADPIAQKPLTTPEYLHLQKLLKDLQVHKMSWPFLQPVDPKDVPDYYDIVPEPMDLTIVEAKLSARAYNKLNDFVKDVTKIFDNCRLYNPVGTAYYQCAEVVETYFAQRIKALRSANKL